MCKPGTLLFALILLLPLNHLSQASSNATLPVINSMGYSYNKIIDDQLAYPDLHEVWMQLRLINHLNLRISGIGYGNAVLDNIGSDFENCKAINGQSLAITPNFRFVQTQRLQATIGLGILGGSKKLLSTASTSSYPDNEGKSHISHELVFSKDQSLGIQFFLEAAYALSPNWALGAQFATHSLFHGGAFGKFYYTGLNLHYSIISGHPQ